LRWPGAVLAMALLASLGAFAWIHRDRILQLSRELPVAAPQSDSTAWRRILELDASLDGEPSNESRRWRITSASFPTIRTSLKLAPGSHSGKPTRPCWTARKPPNPRPGPE